MVEAGIVLAAVPDCDVVLPTGVAVFMGAVPVAATWLDQPYFLTQFSRIMVYAIAACGLNLLVGYTGLVSFGHALYLGLGAYAWPSPPSTAWATAGCNWPGRWVARPWWRWPPAWWCCAPAAWASS